MLVWLSGRYGIRSNRESGYGCYDLALTLIDPGKQGIIMEFKCVAHDEKGVPDNALTQALEQIETRRYARDMIAAGVKEILKIAVVFQGKQLWVKSERLSQR